MLRPEETGQLGAPPSQPLVEELEPRRMLSVVSFSSVPASVAENAGSATVVVSLDSSSSNTITVDLTSSNGTATAGSDYSPVSTTLWFFPGQTTATVTVWGIASDLLYEGNEDFLLNLSNAAGATIGTPQATVTILDADSPPTVEFMTPGASVWENVFGGAAHLTVWLSGSTALTTTVHYETANGTALAGLDYTAVSGTLTIAPGVWWTSFTVPITNDSLDEDNEYLLLSLSSPTNATLGTANATLTITDDADPSPSVQLSASSYSVAENVSGGQVLVTVTLTSESGRTVSVSYSTADGTASTGTDHTVTVTD